MLTGGRNLDALRFLVCCLPPREVVWLGCLATQNARERVPLTEENAAALGAAEQWVYHPEEEHRHAARVASERGDSGSPASLTALAVYYTGGSIGPENGPEVPPPPGLAARLVESALIVACTDDDPDRSALHVRTLLEQALDIAGGGSGRRHEQSS